MSVLACRRNGCPNIMCDRYSFTYGYLCNECFEELKFSDSEISDFMETPKGTFAPDDYSTYEREFPLSEEK